MPLNLFSRCDFDFKTTFYDKLNPKEKDAYDKFVVEIDEELKRYGSESQKEVRDEDEEPNEETKLRFLMADSFDVKLAKERLLRTLSWRKKRNVAYLARNEPPKYDLYLRKKIRRIVGHDREHRPIIAERFGETLSINNKAVMSMEDWKECVIHETEQMVIELNSQSIKHKKPVGKTVTILDLKGATWSGALRNLSYFQELDKEMKDHYPELAGRIIIVNSSYFAVKFFNNIVKKFLAPETARKVEMYTKMPKQALMKIAEADQIPAEYGGEMDDMNLYPHIDAT